MRFEFLLAFVMLSTPAVALAQASAPATAPELTLIVTIDATGRVIVDGDVVPEAALTTQLKAHRDSGSTSALVRADSKVPYGRVLAVEEALTAAGFARIAFDTPPAR